MAASWFLSSQATMLREYVLPTERLRSDNLGRSLNNGICLARIGSSFRLVRDRTQIAAMRRPAGDLPGLLRTQPFPQPSCFGVAAGTEALRPRVGWPGSFAVTEPVLQGRTTRHRTSDTCRFGTHSRPGRSLWSLIDDSGDTPVGCCCLPLPPELPQSIQRHSFRGGV